MKGRNHDIYAMDAVLEVIRDDPGATTADLREAIPGMGRRRMNRALRDLRRSGSVVRRREGLRSAWGPRRWGAVTTGSWRSWRRPSPLYR